MKTIILVIIAGMLLMQACSTSTGEVANKPFELSDTAMKMIQIDTVKMADVKSELKLTGKVTFDEDKVLKIYPQVSGKVEDVKVKLGDRVQKGQVLAVIQSGDVANFEQQLSVAQSNLQMAQKNLDAAQDMFKAGISSEKDLMSAKNEYSKAQAELNRIQQMSKVMSLGTHSEYVIKAPISGFIVERNINNDMQIRSDFQNNLFTISDLTDVFVDAVVYESDISKVKEGYEADVVTLSYPDKVFKAKIDKVLNVLDPVSKTMKVRVRLQNPDYTLKPEMFASVTVRFSENKQMVAIPARSVIFDKSRNFVMVYHSRSKFDTREVSVYKTVGDVAYILNGLKEGESIISKYQLLVYDQLND